MSEHDKYRGMTYPWFLRFKLVQAFWRRFMCPKEIHLFDEVLSGGSPWHHYLVCDAPTQKEKTMLDLLNDQPKMKQCPVCYTLVTETSDTCAICRHRFNERSKNLFPTGLIAIGVLGCIVVVAGFMYLFLSQVPIK